MNLYDVRNELNQGKTIYDLPLRVTYYARVSTEKEEQIHSLAAQVDYYRDFIARCNRWTFVEGYVDEGVSGTGAEKREHFMRMIHDGKNGRFDFVVTKEISRFSRSTLDSIQYTQELLRCGVGVFFQSDNLNTLMPDAELRLTILSSIAQDEVRKISERVKFGFQRAIESGVVLGNNRIWGYEKQNGKLIVRESEAEIVRIIFDLYANQKMGIRAISDRLTQLGYQNTKGNDFSFSTVRGILVNPKYKGYYCGRKSCKYDYRCSDRKYFPEEEWVQYRDEDTVPPIIPEALWEKANKLLAQRSDGQRSKTGYHNKYPYSGKIICSTHHAPFYHAVYRSQKGKREIWQCCQYRKKGKSGCKIPFLYTEELNQIVGMLLEELPLKPSEIHRKLLRIYGSIGILGLQGEEINRVKSGIEEIRRRKNKLLELNLGGHISNEEFRVRNEQFNAEMAARNTQLSQLEEARKNRPNREAQMAVIHREIEKELDFTDEFSLGFIDALLDRIEVDDGEDGQIHVSLHSELFPQGYQYRIQRRRGKPSLCSRQYI